MANLKENSAVQDMSIREKLLSCATELFNRKGYVSTTVREIVAEAGVTKPVLYYYFGNKEGIYKELMRPPFVKLEALLIEFQKKEGSGPLIHQSASQRIPHGQFCVVVDSIRSNVREDLEIRSLNVTGVDAILRGCYDGPHSNRLSEWSACPGQGIGSLVVVTSTVSGQGSG